MGTCPDTAAVADLRGETARLQRLIAVTDGAAVTDAEYTTYTDRQAVCVCAMAKLGEDKDRLWRRRVMVEGGD